VVRVWCGVVWQRCDVIKAVVMFTVSVVLCGMLW